MIEGREVRQPRVVLVGDPDAVIPPGHRERSPLGVHPLAVVGDVAAGDRAPPAAARRAAVRLGSLTSKSVPKTTSTFRALGAQTEKRMPSFVRPGSPMLLGAEAAVVGQVVSLLLDGIAVAAVGA